MPVVPNLETPSVQAEGLPGRPIPRISDDVSPQDFGSGLAKGIEDVGAAGAEQEAVLKRRNDAMRVVDANTQLEAAKTSMLYGTEQPDGTRKGGAYSMHGTAAINMPATILPEYDKAAQQISSTLTPDQQRLFQTHIASNKNELDLGLNRYEYEESNRLATQVFTNGVKQTISNASVGWRDPDQIAKSRLDLKGLVQLQGDREGWGADEKAQQLAKMQAEMHFNVVDRMLADGSPQSALGYFKSVRDTGELTGEQAHQLGAQIDAALQQGKAQNQTDLLARIGDVRAAAVNGLSIPPSSMPSKSEILAAFPQDGQRRWDAIQSDISMGATLKSMSGQSATEMQATVDAAKPSQVGGAAEQLERYQLVAQAAQRVAMQRNADPRQAVIDNKLGSNALNFGDLPGTITELKSRLQATSTDSARFGMYVPPLSKQEQSQFAQRLESMPAMDRARTLATLNQGLNDDRGFQTLMHQIMPGSPVTAIVGSQLNQSTPANTPVWMDRRFDRDPTELTRTLAGEALLNPQGLEKQGAGKFKLPSEEGSQSSTGLRQSFQLYADTAIANRPELAEATYAAFKANYAQRLAESGNISGIPGSDDAKLRQAALKATVGNVVRFNSGTVAVPPGLDPSRFQSVVEAAVAARARLVGFDPAQIKGYKLEEVGALGSGRYQLVQGNALVVNPGGKVFPTDQRDANGQGLFQIDIRNQYLARAGATATQADLRRQAAEQPPAPSKPVEAVAGSPTKTKDVVEASRVIKAPATPGLSRGGSGRGGKAHPSQGPIAE